MMSPLLISQGLDGVVAGGAKAGIERAEAGARERDDKRDGPPGVDNDHGNGGGDEGADDPAGAVAHEDSENGSEQTKRERFDDYDPENETVGTAEGFEIGSAT